MKRNHSWTKSQKRLSQHCATHRQLVVRDERSIDFSQVLEDGWYVVEIVPGNPEDIAFDGKGDIKRNIRGVVIEGPYTDRQYARWRCDDLR